MAKNPQLVKAAEQMVAKQVAKTRAAANVRFDKFMKLAEKADTEKKRAKYLKAAFQAGALAEASIAGLQAQLEKFRKQ